MKARKLNGERDEWKNLKWKKENESKERRMEEERIGRWTDREKIKKNCDGGQKWSVKKS